jgi:hypothetical protein
VLLFNDGVICRLFFLFTWSTCQPIRGHFYLLWHSDSFFLMICRARRRGSGGWAPRPAFSGATVRSSATKLRLDNNSDVFNKFFFSRLKGSRWIYFRCFIETTESVTGTKMSKSDPAVSLTPREQIPRWHWHRVIRTFQTITSSIFSPNTGTKLYAKRR